MKGSGYYNLMNIRAMQAQRFYGFMLGIRSQLLTRDKVTAVSMSEEGAIATAEKLRRHGFDAEAVGTTVEVTRDGD